VGENEVLVKVRAIGLNPIDIAGESNLLSSWIVTHELFSNRVDPCVISSPQVLLRRRRLRRVRFHRRSRKARTKPQSQYRDRRQSERDCHWEYVLELSPHPPGGSDSVDLPNPFSLDSASGRGGFAEYAKVPSDLVWKIPQGTLSFEEAAATGSPYVPQSRQSRLFPHMRFRYDHQPQHGLPSLVRGPRTGATPTPQLRASKRDRRNLGLHLRRKFRSRPIRNPTRQAFGLQSCHSCFPSQSRVREVPWSGCGLRCPYLT